MSENRYALVLTGAVVPGFDPERAWSDLSTFFRIDAARLHADVLARAPVAIKESSDLASLETLRDGALARGVAIEIHVLDERGSVFALIDRNPRGPLPYAYVEQCVRSGMWSADVELAEVGSSQWRRFVEPMSVAALAQAPVAGASAVVAMAQGFDDRHDPSQRLPAGPAIHAGFWRRSAAYLIDSLILLIPSWIVLMVPFLGFLVNIIGRWLYFALMESSPSQATLGKRMMGIIVTDGRGQRIGFGQATGRYFGAAISTLILYIGYMLAGWTERKQALHDLMADTCVVFDGVQPGKSLPTARPAMPWYGWAANALLFVGIPVAGILAAIAVPAYQDYVMRARVMNVISDASEWRVEANESVHRDGKCLVDERFNPKPLIGSVRFGGQDANCWIEITLTSSSELPDAIRAKLIRWQRTGSGEWDCRSTIAHRYLPASCR
jgi:uncharacterized RDD family membrane protein YckC